MLGPFLLLLQLSVALVAGKRAQDDVNLPNYNIYHTKDGMLKAVREAVAACPSIMSVQDRYKGTEGGYNTTMTIVTVEPGGLTNNHANKTRFLLNYGEHGRELISSELALALLHTFCNETALEHTLAGLEINPKAVANTLSHTIFKIIPMENTRGREKVEKGEYCERKNGRGVDPNRNWEVDWGAKEPDYDPAEEYPGTGPFSEPEAVLLKSLAEEFRPHAWINVHSGMEALFMPYDHKSSIPQGPEGMDFLKLLQHLNRIICGGRCAVGSGGQAVGYLAHGTATDYMHEALQIPIASTWEVYGDFNASYYDCFRMFNPLDMATYSGVMKNWTAAVYGLVTAMEGIPNVLDYNVRLPGIIAEQKKKVQEAATAAKLAAAAGHQQQHGGPAAAGSNGGGGDDVKKTVAAAAVANATMAVAENAAHTRPSSSSETVQQHQEQEKEQHEKEKEYDVVKPQQDNNNNNIQGDNDIDDKTLEQQQQAQKRPGITDNSQQQAAEQQQQAQPRKPIIEEEIELIIPGDTTTTTSSNNNNNNNGRGDIDTEVESRLVGRKEGIFNNNDHHHHTQGLPTGVDSSTSSNSSSSRSDSRMVPWIGLLLTAAVVAGAVHSKSRLRGNGGSWTNGNGNYGGNGNRWPSPNRWGRRPKRGALIGLN